jgi:hypothetical protein
MDGWLLPLCMSRAAIKMQRQFAHDKEGGKEDDTYLNSPWTSSRQAVSKNALESVNLDFFIKKNTLEIFR